MGISALNLESSMARELAGWLGHTGAGAGGGESEVTEEIVSASQ